MAHISDAVEYIYGQEVRTIGEAGGRLWPKWIGLTVLCLCIWGYDLIFGDPWKKQMFSYAVMFILGAPLIEREWERYKIAARMRHERQVRVEVKLDSLLGFHNIKDDDD